LAPIQISDYAHPFTSFDARIDYVLGSHIEQLPSSITFDEHGWSTTRHPHYSETLVLMPFWGVINTPLSGRQFPLRPLPLYAYYFVTYFVILVPKLMFSSVL
jgi:hypothetical protein